MDVTVDERLPWNSVVAMRDRLEVAARRFGGVLPLNAEHLAIRCPDLWKTPKAAKRDIERKMENHLKAPVYNKYIYSKPGLFRINVIAISNEYIYRLKGQRGRPTRAWSNRSITETRQRLEQEFGELAYFLPPMFAEFFPSHDDDGNEHQNVAFQSGSLMAAYHMLVGSSPPP